MLPCCGLVLGQIDAMGGKRGRVSVGSNSDRQTLNQLLACMDGFTKNEGVIVIGMCARVTEVTVPWFAPAVAVPKRGLRQTCLSAGARGVLLVVVHMSHSCHPGKAPFLTPGGLSVRVLCAL